MDSVHYNQTSNNILDKNVDNEFIVQNGVISVIVPVYKAEEFIDRCVNSVINQTYHQWELLLIDDGSPDNSPSMCDEWMKKDNRIKTYHKENGGVSSARNLGLDNIHGHWITFIDADDYIEPKCFEECLEHAVKNDLDVLQFRMKRVFMDGTIKYKNEESSPICDTGRYIKSGFMSGCVWGGLYKSSIFKDNHIRFNEKLHYLEDAFVVCEILKHSKSNQRWNKHFYMYYYNPNGSDKPKDWDYYLDSIEYAAEYKKNNPLYGNLIDGWCTMLAMRYITLADKHTYNRFAQAWKQLRISDDYLQTAGRKDVVYFERTRRVFGIKVSFFLTKALSRLYYTIIKKK